MKSTGLIAIACAVALTAACTSDVRDDNRPINETEQFENNNDRGVGTSGAADQQATGTTGTGISSDARDFVEKAAQGGMAEVQLGKLASERGQNAQVKQFGTMMVRDHTKANDELKQVVSAYNVALPTGLDQKHMDLMEKLRNLRGAEFDREYISAMVDGHQEMQGLLEDRAGDAGDTTPATARGTDDTFDAALAQWAAKAKPTVDQHLKTAQQIEDSLQAGNPTK